MEELESDVDSDADTIPYGDSPEEDVFARDSPESPEGPDAKRPRLT